MAYDKTIKSRHYINYITGDNINDKLIQVLDDIKQEIISHNWEHVVIDIEIRAIGLKDIEAHVKIEINDKNTKI